MKKNTDEIYVNVQSPLSIKLQLFWWNCCNNNERKVRNSTISFFIEREKNLFFFWNMSPLCENMKQNKTHNDESVRNSWVYNFAKMSNLNCPLPQPWLVAASKWRGKWEEDKLDNDNFEYWIIAERGKPSGRSIWFIVFCIFSTRSLSKEFVWCSRFGGECLLACLLAWHTFVNMC